MNNLSAISPKTKTLIISLVFFILAVVVIAAAQSDQRSLSRNSGSNVNSNTGSMDTSKPTTQDEAQSTSASQSATQSSGNAISGQSLQSGQPVSVPAPDPTVKRCLEGYSTEVYPPCEPCPLLSDIVCIMEFE